MTHINAFERNEHETIPCHINRKIRYMGVLGDVLRARHESEAGLHCPDEFHEEETTTGCDHIMVPVPEIPQRLQMPEIVLARSPEELLKELPRKTMDGWWLIVKDSLVGFRPAMVIVVTEDPGSLRPRWRDW